MTPLPRTRPNYNDIKAEDLEKADKLLMEAEAICRYWHFTGSERGILHIRSRLIRARNRAKENIGA